jgi:hypothetical protein
MRHSAQDVELFFSLIATWHYKNVWGIITEVS